MQIIHFVNSGESNFEFLSLEKIGIKTKKENFVSLSLLKGQLTVGQWRVNKVYLNNSNLGERDPTVFSHKNKKCDLN